MVSNSFLFALIRSVDRVEQLASKVVGACVNTFPKVKKDCFSPGGR